MNYFMLKVISGTIEQPYMNLNLNKLNIVSNSTFQSNLTITLRSNNKFKIPFYSNNIGQKLINYRGVLMYNDLPPEICTLDASINRFKIKQKLKNYSLCKPP